MEKEIVLKQEDIKLEKKLKPVDFFQRSDILSKFSKDVDELTGFKNMEDITKQIGIQADKSCGLEVENISVEKSYKQVWNCETIDGNSSMEQNSEDIATFLKPQVCSFPQLKLSIVNDRIIYELEPTFNPNDPNDGTDMEKFMIENTGDCSEDQICLEVGNPWGPEIENIILSKPQVKHTFTANEIIDENIEQIDGNTNMIEMSFDGLTKSKVLSLVPQPIPSINEQTTDDSILEEVEFSGSSDNDDLSFRDFFDALDDPMPSDSESQMTFKKEQEIFIRAIDYNLASQNVVETKNELEIPKLSTASKYWDSEFSNLEKPPENNSSIITSGTNSIANEKRAKSFHTTACTSADTLLSQHCHQLTQVSDPMGCGDAPGETPSRLVDNIVSESQHETIDLVRQNPMTNIESMNSNKRKNNIQKYNIQEINDELTQLQVQEKQIQKLNTTKIKNEQQINYLKKKLMYLKIKSNKQTSQKNEFIQILNNEMKKFEQLITTKIITEQKYNTNILTEYQNLKLDLNIKNETIIKLENKLKEAQQKNHNVPINYKQDKQFNIASQKIKLIQSTKSLNIIKNLKQQNILLQNKINRMENMIIEHECIKCKNGIFVRFNRKCSTFKSKLIDYMNNNEKCINHNTYQTIKNETTADVLDKIQLKKEFKKTKLTNKILEDIAFQCQKSKFDHRNYKNNNKTKLYINNTSPSMSEFDSETETDTETETEMDIQQQQQQQQQQQNLNEKNKFLNLIPIKFNNSTTITSPILSLDARIKKFVKNSKQVTDCANSMYKKIFHKGTNETMPKVNGSVEISNKMSKEEEEKHL